MDKEFIANTLLQLATYGRVSFAQSDIRWQKTIQAYHDFCIASGMEPMKIFPGTDGSRVAEKSKATSFDIKDVAKAADAIVDSFESVFLKV